MRTTWTAILVILVVAACASPPPPEVDTALGDQVGMTDAQLLAIQRAGANARQLEGITDGGDALLAPGVTIDVPEDDAFETVRSLRRELGPGHLVFVSERNFGIGGELDEVSVLKGDDPYLMLRTMGTNGWNYDLGPDAVIARLKQWDSQFGLDYVGVSFDWVEATFVRTPSDMATLAAEVYEFCPDVVDQGTGTIDALVSEMRRSNTLFLWWD